MSLRIPVLGAAAACYVAAVLVTGVALRLPRPAPFVVAKPARPVGAPAPAPTPAPEPVVPPLLVPAPPVVLAPSVDVPVDVPAKRPSEERAAAPAAARPEAPPHPPAAAPPAPPPTPVPAAPPPAAMQPAPPPTPEAREDALLLQARELAKAGDAKGAETLYLKLLSSGGRRTVAAMRLGDLYLSQGDYARAGEMYRESSRILKESLAPGTPRPAAAAPAPTAP